MILFLTYEPPLQRCVALPRRLLMIEKPCMTVAAAILSIVAGALLVACGDDGLSRSDVQQIVQSEIANIPTPVPQETSREQIEEIVQELMVEDPDEETSDGADIFIPRKSSPDQYTQYLVNEAIDMYESEGLDATVAYYNTNDSIDGQWYVFISDEDDIIVAHAANPDLVNRPASSVTGPNEFPSGAAVAAAADEDGEWLSYTFTNPATGGSETKHSWLVRYDGLLFGSGWYEPGPSKSDAPAYTQSFVQQSINLYDAVGLEETVAYYNRKESIDGQWYVFISDEDDIIIAHAANPELVNTAASSVTGPNEFPSGAAVAAVADEDGEWLSYTFTNPATGGSETKHSWLVRYDGLLFGSGWYEPGPSKSDAPAYTQSFVQQSINLYDAVGLEETVAYYNRKESIDGQWYVFISDEDDIIIAHAANPDLVNTAASSVTGPNEFPSGAAVAAVADEDGEWLSYTFTNPATGGSETKHSWLVRYDGLLFGSGWYEPGPSKSDAPAYTQSFVQQSINLYDAVGLEETVAYYNRKESIDGQWYVFIIDEDDFIIAHAAIPDLVNRPASYATGPNDYPTGAAVAAVADEDGEWFSYTYPNPATGGVETKHSWTVRYDGIIFGSGWYEPGPSKSDAPAYTQSLVTQGISLYGALGLDAAIEYYSSEESRDGPWYVFIIGEDGYTVAHPNPMFIGRDPSLRIDAAGYFYGDDLLGATENGRWIHYVLENPASEQDRQKHSWIVFHDGFYFGSGWYE